MNEMNDAILSLSDDSLLRLARAIANSLILSSMSEQRLSTEPGVRTLTRWHNVGEMLVKQAIASIPNGTVTLRASPHFSFLERTARMLDLSLLDEEGTPIALSARFSTSMLLFSAVHGLSMGRLIPGGTILIFSGPGYAVEAFRECLYNCIG